jgi:hypothetical protein
VTTNQLAVANLSGMATEALPPANDAGQPGPQTTAGKIAGLEQRRYEASGSTGCSTPARSPSSTSWPGTAPPTSA